MNRHGQRLWCLATSVILGLVLTVSAAQSARGDQDFQWQAPAVWVITHDLNGMTAQDFDATVVGLLDSLEPREASATQGGNTAWAAANLNQFAARAASASPGDAVSWAFMDFIVHDSQDRELVKVNLGSKVGSNPDRGFSGVASAANDGASAANFSIMVYPWPGWGDLTLDDHNNLVDFVRPPVFDPAVAFRAAASVNCYMAAPTPPADQPVPRCRWDKSVVLYDAIVTDYGQGDGSSVSLQALPSLSLQPGWHYVIAIQAYAGGNAMATVDPLVEPDPDNPDIVIEFPNAVSDPSPQPIMAGITSTALQALGIDPQPFIDLGFLDSPAADTTPPTTAASTSPAPNANGWNKSAVTVALTATDAGGSGVREIRYALGGASSGSQVVPGGSATVSISTEGSTTLTYFAVDNAGNQEASHMLTVRIDATGPTLAGLPAPDCSLWPPTHEMVQVAGVTATDSLSGLAGPPVVSVTSNEPAKMGRRDPAPDVVVSEGVVKVRAERSSKGTGRVYTITASANDLAGNSSSATAICTVPHDHRHTAWR